jgi:hypothetical protein
MNIKTKLNVELPLPENAEPKTINNTAKPETANKLTARPF